MAISYHASVLQRDIVLWPLVSPPRTGLCHRVLLGIYLSCLSPSTSDSVPWNEILFYIFGVVSSIRELTLSGSQLAHPWDGL